MHPTTMKVKPHRSSGPSKWRFSNPQVVIFPEYVEDFTTFARVVSERQKLHNDLF